MQAQTEHKDRIFLGIAFCLVANFLFSLMSLGGIYLYKTAGYHPVEIAFYRNLVVFVPLALALLVTRKFSVLKTRKPLMMGLRSFTAALTLIGIFSAMSLLPMSYATVIFFASSLLTPVLAVAFLGETMGKHRWIAILIGMGGVLLIARPAGEVSLIGFAVAAVTACLFSVQHTSLRGLKTESPMTIIMYLVIVGLIVQGAMMPWFVTQLPSDEFWIFILVGGFASAGQYCLSSAYKYAPTTIITPFGYSGLLWATLYDVLVWKYEIDYIPVLAGAVLVIAAQLYIMHREYLNGKAAVAQ